MFSIDDIKRKVRSLLALSGDQGATDHEADAALRFARALMLKHNVAPEDVHEQAGEAEAVEYAKETEGGLGAKHAGWEGTLALAISKLVGTVGVYRDHARAQRRDEKGERIYDVAGEAVFGAGWTFYGPRSDVAEARDLFRAWALTIAALARLEYGGAMRGDGAMFSQGFATALYRKVEAIEREEREILALHKNGQQLTDGERSSALVLVSALPAMAEQLARGKAWLKNSQGIHLGGARRSSGYRGSHDAYGRGSAAGSKADLRRASRAKQIGGGS